MKFAVFGVGAMGGIIGGYLARYGRDVTLIDTWPMNIEKIKSQGLKISTPEEEFTVKVPAFHLGEIAAIKPQFDAVFLSVKSYDTPWATMFMKPTLAPKGFIISAQNGINDETIAALVGWPRVIGLVITLGGAMEQAGHATRTTPKTRHSMTVGELNGLISCRAESIAKYLSVIGPSKVTNNLWGERWAKLATNCSSNAVSGFTGLSSAGTRTNNKSRKLAISIIWELIEVAEALGVSLEPIAGIPTDVWLRAQTGVTALNELDSMLIESSKAFPQVQYPSLAQDVSKGRKTEVDLLNGYVVQKGQELGIATPVNQQVVNITNRVENNDLEPKLDNLDLIKL